MSTTDLIVATVAAPLARYAATLSTAAMCRQQLKQPQPMKHAEMLRQVADVQSAHDALNAIMLRSPREPVTEPEAAEMLAVMFAAMKARKTDDAATEAAMMASASMFAAEDRIIGTARICGSRSARIR